MLLSEAAKNNIDDGKKDLLPTKFFHSSHTSFFSFIPIPECIQPKTLEINSKMYILDS